MKILMILTSHSRLGESDHKTGLWLEEFTTPYYTFSDLGVDVILASPSGGPAPVDPRSTEDSAQSDSTRRFQQDPRAQEHLASTLVLSQIDPALYDAVFFPGGHGPMWDLASSQETARLVEDFYRHGKVIGAVCHGPAALILARDDQGNSILQGKEVTGFTNAEERAVELDQVVPFLLEDRLRELSGQFRSGEAFQPHVVVDGQIVTGQNPPSSVGTAQAVLEALNRVKSSL